MLEKWKSLVDKEKAFGILLTDLSKVFDCLSNELIIAKLNAYGFSLPALKLMQSCLLERKQRTKVTTQFMMQLTILMRSYSPCKNLLKNFLNGSLIIKRKLMKTNVI